MSLKKKRKSFLERAEESALEHIPEKYQKSVVGVYRLGYCMSMIGILSVVFATLAIYICIISKNGFDLNAFTASAVGLVAASGVTILGARYLKMRMNPASAFGWAIAVGLISFVLAGFFGFIFIASVFVDLDPIYGQAIMISVRIIMACSTVLPLIIFLNAAYYVLFAHKGYTKWYAGYAKRNHLGAKAKTVKKPSRSSGYRDDNL